MANIRSLRTLRRVTLDSAWRSYLAGQRGPVRRSRVAKSSLRSLSSRWVSVRLEPRRLGTSLNRLNEIVLGKRPHVGHCASTLAVAEDSAATLDAAAGGLGSASSHAA